jgi:hypothetical protein
MRLALRRLRGLAVSMLLWSVPWTVLGALIGLVLVSDPFQSTFGVTVFGHPNFPGGLPTALALLGSLVGAINGLVFGLLLMLGERKRAFTELRQHRVGLWAAVATAATVYLGVESLPVAGIAAACGFVGGAIALRLARRSHTTTTVEASA